MRINWFKVALGAGAAGVAFGLYKVTSASAATPTPPQPANPYVPASYVPPQAPPPPPLDEPRVVYEPGERPFHEEPLDAPPPPPPPFIPTAPDDPSNPFATNEDPTPQDNPNFVVTQTEVNDSPFAPLASIIPFF